MKALMAIMLLAAATGPLQCGEERTEEGDRAKLAEMEARIDELIGDARCTDNAECKAIAFGAKPCGGPWKYKVYSTAAVSEQTLIQRVEAYNAFNRELNEKYGWVSDCMAVGPPSVECRDGRCGVVEPK